MRARWLFVSALCAALACEDDPVAPPIGPTAAFEVTPGSGDPRALDAVVVRDLFVLPPGTHTARPAGLAFDVPISTPEASVQALANSYRRRDLDLFAALLANDPSRNAEFLFLLSEPTDVGETQWGYTEEVRLHQRMFHPEDVPPGDPPVSSDLWMQGLTITLTPQEQFSERLDLYSENGGLDGKLDPALWRAMDARYSTYVFFDLTGVDYKVDGDEANFVVIEDLSKSGGEPGRFLLYIWEDLGCPTCPSPAKPKVETSSWSSVKQLFR